MKIHEYQGKEILRKYGVAVLDGRVAATAAEAENAAVELGGGLCVVKAQIHAGGRGKAGGVKLAKTPDEARGYAEALLGSVLVTHQTGPEGKQVHKVFVEQGCEIENEYYLGLVIDRATSRITVMASSEGGSKSKKSLRIRRRRSCGPRWIQPSGLVNFKGVSWHMVSEYRKIRFGKLLFL